MTVVAAPAPRRPVPYSTRPAARLGYLLTIVLVAWGALSFGAVYPWAYWPLAIGAQAAGFLGVFTECRAVAGMSRRLGISLIVLAAAMLVQVVPLSRNALHALSPATVDLLSRIDLAFAFTGTHTVSIDASATWTAIALVASFALLAAGTSRLVSVSGAPRFVAGMTVVGVVLALVGIVQKPLFGWKIYGFWIPEAGRDPFGPFVNKNHFAGWMLMAIPLTLGLLLAGLTREMRGIKPDWRARLLWFSSPVASKLVLLAGAVGVMALSLVLTLSRSGIAALAVAFALTAWLVLRASASASPRFIGVGLLGALTVLLVGWVGADVISARFAAADWRGLNARWGAWGDAWGIAMRFPLFGTGLNTYGIATLFYQQHDLMVHYAQAHNDYLQLAAEGGLLVSIPAAACVAVFVKDVRRRLSEDAGSSAYWIRVGAVTALVAIALQETVEFSLQMPGNAALFAVVCGIASHKTPGRRVPPNLEP